MRVVYSVYGDDRNFEEFRRSVRSILEHHPNAEIECYTDAAGLKKVEGLPVQANLLDVSARSVRWHDPNFKVSAILHAATRPFLFLDNDTYLAAPIHDAWQLLGRYDMLGCLAPKFKMRERLKYSKHPAEEAIPEAFPEVNGGVLFFSSNNRVRRLLSRWKQLIDENEEELGDQWRLRIALYESDVRFLALTPNYNFRIDFCPPIFGLVRIFHSHHSRIAEVAIELNSDSGYRHVEKRNGTFVIKRLFRSRLKRKVMSFLR